MIKHEYAEIPAARLNLLRSTVSVLKGTVFGYIFLVICFAVLAVVYTYTPFPAGLLAPFTKGITALSIIICAIISARNINGFGWLHGAAAGFAYTIIRLIAATVSTNGFSLDKTVPEMLLFGLILGAIGGIIGINFKKL